VIATHRDTIGTTGVDENGNLIDPPTVELPEFNGGVNGVLPDSIELPELMIEVRWIDEDGNVLKPSVKTGNEKDAEHRSIPGYEFVKEEKLSDTEYRYVYKKIDKKADVNNDLAESNFEFNSSIEFKEFNFSYDFD